jgi:hypothetical protein
MPHAPVGAKKGINNNDNNRGNFNGSEKARPLSLIMIMFMIKTIKYIA